MEDTLSEWVDLDERNVMRCSRVSVRRPSKDYDLIPGRDVFLVSQGAYMRADSHPKAFDNLGAALDFAHHEGCAEVIVTPLGGNGEGGE